MSVIAIVSQNKGIGVILASDIMTAYSFFKDFSAPLATVFAATVAAIVTFYFNKRQTEIAKSQMGIAASQRDIATDKLKVDLFKERYGIYEAAKLLISIIANLRDFDDVGRRNNEIRDLYVKLEEARFFFDPDICAFLEKLHSNAESFLTELSADVSADDAAAWSARAERLTTKQAILRQMYADLPKKFQSALEFTQLTKNVAIKGRSK